MHRGFCTLVFFIDVIIKSQTFGYIHLVVLWSDSVGAIHLWEGTIRWSTRYESFKRFKERRETGETRQPGLPR